MRLKLISFCDENFDVIKQPVRSEIVARAWTNADICPPQYESSLVETDGGLRFDFESHGQKFYAYYKK